jgi:outer membrane protein OmpA-like peptidoglycan-associated protein
MDQKDKNLDKFIRDKISPFSVSGKKGNWKLLQHLLFQHSKANRRKKKLKILVSSLLIVSVSIMFVLFSPYNVFNGKTEKSSVQDSHSEKNSEMNSVATNKNDLNHRKNDSNLHWPFSNDRKYISNIYKSPSEFQHSTSVLFEENDFVVSKSILSAGESITNASQNNYSSLEVSALINSCSWTSDSIKVEIVNIGMDINTAYADFAPVISPDGLTMYYTSRKPVSKTEIQKGKQSLEHIYKSSFDIKNNKWTNASTVENINNILGRNNSVIGLSHNGMQMFIYRDDNNGNGDIYVSGLIDARWTEAVKLPEPINSIYHESSASLSSDGKTLYFVSDRPGGIGGRDIWLSNIDSGGHWGTAINAGALVNTRYDEEGVYIHHDGTLYFSSKGHNSLGGYDIFRTVIKNNNWDAPLNLLPLNTKADEVYFVMYPHGGNGYYSSSKSGGFGEKDIYKVSFSLKSSTFNADSKFVICTGIVIDKQTSAPLDAEVEIFDNTGHKPISATKANSITGEFEISLIPEKNYVINVTKAGYLFYADKFKVSLSDTSRAVSKIVPLEKLIVGEKILLNNIFYDFNKATLRSESVFELQQLIALMENNPLLKIEINSYTDSRGSYEYNLSLSQARAQAVIEYLFNNGISKTRLIAKGYGENLPVVSNANAGGRQFNRRTEFKIISK